jgi:aminoglycoside phosphotransferase (APT) family kinase protein
MIDVEATAVSLAEQLGHPTARLVHLRDGREHHLFRVSLPEGERLLKFPRSDALSDPYERFREAADRLRAESWAVRFARGAVPVPTPYTFYETEPVCSVMEWVAGTTGEIAYERGELDEDELLRVCVELGRTLGDLHGRKRPADGGRLPDLPGADPATARLLHLDYHLGNVILRRALGSGFAVEAVIDWTCARWGPPEADLVEIQVSVFALNPRARDAFVTGYRRSVPRAIDLRDVERRAAIEIRRRLVEDPPDDPVLLRRWEDWAATRPH